MQAAAEVLRFNATSSFPITATFAAVLGVAFAAASSVVAVTRAVTAKYYGADKNSPLEFRARAAGTIGEFGTIGIVLLALLEARQAYGATGLWWWGILFTAARLMHALQLALPRTVPLIFRAGGFWLTMLLIVSASLKLFFGGR